MEASSVEEAVNQLNITENDESPRIVSAITPSSGGSILWMFICGADYARLHVLRLSDIAGKSLSRASLTKSPFVDHVVYPCPPKMFSNFLPESLHPNSDRRKCLLVGKNLKTNGDADCSAIIVVQLPEEACRAESAAIKDLNENWKLLKENRCLVARLSSYDTADSLINVMEVAWHPMSVVHVCYLADDGYFRMYNLQKSFEDAELKVHVSNDTVSSFCFGHSSFSQGNRWESFTVYILMSNGDIYTICPVVPSGALLPHGTIEDLHYACVHSNASDLVTKFIGCNIFDGSPSFSISNNYNYEVIPKNVDISGNGKSQYYELFCSIPARRILCLDVSPPVVAVASSDGVLATFLVVDDVEPHWENQGEVDSVPQRLLLVELLQLGSSCRDDNISECQLVIDSSNSGHVFFGFQDCHVIVNISWIPFFKDCSEFNGIINDPPGSRACAIPTYRDSPVILAASCSLLNFTYFTIVVHKNGRCHLSFISDENFVDNKDDLSETFAVSDFVNCILSRLEMPSRHERHNIRNKIHGDIFDKMDNLKQKRNELWELCKVTSSDSALTKVSDLQNSFQKLNLEVRKLVAHDLEDHHLREELALEQQRRVESLNSHVGEEITMLENLNEKIEKLVKGNNNLRNRLDVILALRNKCDVEKGRYLVESLHRASNIIVELKNRMDVIQKRAVIRIKHISHSYHPYTSQNPDIPFSVQTSLLKEISESSIKLCKFRRKLETIRSSLVLPENINGRADLIL